MSDGPLTLWVLRHAKAARDDPGGDRTRPLTKRGRRQAESVRDHLGSLTTPEQRRLPGLVVSSPAARARETAELVMPALPRAAFTLEEVLYSEEAPEILEWLRKSAPGQRSIMLVGHNPTLEELCGLLEPRAAGGSRRSEPLGTAGLVGLESAGSRLPVAEVSQQVYEAANSWGQLREESWSVFHRFRPEP